MKELSLPVPLIWRFRNFIRVPRTPVLSAKSSYLLSLQRKELALCAVRRVWQFAQVTSHLFISSFMAFVDMLVMLATSFFFLPLVWSNSNTIGSLSPHTIQECFDKYHHNHV